MKKFTIAAATALVLVTASTSFAQVRLNTASITANNNQVTNQATGRGAKAVVRAGVIRGDVQARGRVSLQVNNNRINNRATQGATSCVEMGVIDGGQRRSNGFLGIGGGSRGGDSC